MTPFSAPSAPNDPQASRPSAGIFKLAHTDLAAMHAAAQELGLACFHVNLSEARNVPGFIRVMKRDLGFPAWFGDNLDALNDCLTDFSWHAAPGYVITLDGLSNLSASPTSFAAFNQVLASAVEEWKARNRPFWVFYLTDETKTDATATRPIA
ncbi:MAG: barstar family protein [Propionivibrio sp.]